MTWDVNGTTELVDFSPTLVALETLDEMDDATQNMLVEYSLDVSDECVAAGSVQTPVFPQVDMEDDVEGTPLEGAQFPSDNVMLTPDTKKAVIIPITNYARAVANQDLMNGYGRQLGRDAMRKIDIGIAGVYAETGNSPVDAGAATDIDEADILAAKELLDLANAPIAGRVLIVHTTQYNAILAIDGLTRFDALGKADAANAKVSGLIGYLHGFLVVQDQNLVTTGSGGTLRRHNIAMVYGGTKQNSSVEWAMSTFRPMVSNTVTAGTRLRLIWTFDTNYGCEVLRGEMQFGFVALQPKWIVDIRTSTT